MPRLWQLAIRNWSVNPGRTIGCGLAVALGVAVVVVITSFYETTRRAVTDELVKHWLGTAHLTVQLPKAWRDSLSLHVEYLDARYFRDGKLDSGVPDAQRYADPTLSAQLSSTRVAAGQAQDSHWKEVPL